MPQNDDSGYCSYWKCPQCWKYVDIGPAGKASCGCGATVDAVADRVAYVPFPGQTLRCRRGIGRCFGTDAALVDVDGYAWCDKCGGELEIRGHVKAAAREPELFAFAKFIDDILVHVPLLGAGERARRASRAAARKLLERLKVRKSTFNDPRFPGLRPTGE